MTDVGSQDPRLSALERYRKQLEALLAMVDGEEPPGHDALAGAWQRCQQTFAQYQAHQDALAAAPCPAEVREAIKESMRMNAVAVSELVRPEAELGARHLSRLRQACDHPYLVRYGVGSEELPERVRNTDGAGDLCGICQELVEDPVKCGRECERG